MQVSMNLMGMSQLTQLLSGGMKRADQRGKQAMRDVTTRWQFEAKLRAPVEYGLLRNTIMKDEGVDNDGIWGAVGSNQEYAKYTEFGTDHIAGGKVKALGTREDVTDAQAIKNWPALDATGGTREQLPWLRPAFMAIREWAIERLASAFRFE